MAASEPLTVLERHVSYFDTDGDGEITIGQTFRGLRRVGVGVVTSALLTLLINGFLGFLTQRRFTLRVSLRDIARGKHPFDTGAFDARGDFDQRAFEALFTAPTASSPFDRLSAVELRSMIHKRGDPKKPFGELGSVLSDWFSGREIQLLLCLASDCKKVTLNGQFALAISRRTLQRFYSGHLLFLLARRRRIAEARRRANSQR